MNNIPKIKVGLVAVSRDCFPAPLAVNRRKALAEAYTKKYGSEDLYESTVLKNFKDEYMGGRTPNPCIWCNQKIKFGAMVEYARAAGLDQDTEEVRPGHSPRRARKRVIRKGS